MVIPAGQGGDLRAYLASLRRVRDVHPRRLLPGHGPIIDDPDAPQTISYRKQFTLTLAAGRPVTMTTGYNGPTATSGEVAWVDNEHALPIIQRMVRARKTAPVA